MEDKTDNPIAVKVEGHSQCVVLTYFQGDINSMVDAHFKRALGKVCKSKAPAAKSKKIRKIIKLEDPNSCQGSAADTYSEPQVPPVAGRLLTFRSADESPGSWQSISGEGPGLQSLAYPMPPAGLSLTGQQYATSLLHLLHSDRGELGPSMASGSKQEMLPSWTVPQGFRETVDPAVSVEPGRSMDKKDLYWY